MKILYCITLLYLFTVFHNFITSSAFWLEKGHQHCLIWILADIQWHLGLLKCMLRSCWVVIGWFWSESEHAHFRQNHVFLFQELCDCVSSFSRFTFCFWSPDFCRVFSCKCLKFESQLNQSHPTSRHVCSTLS